jgi:hypothetical protein
MDRSERSAVRVLYTSQQAMLLELINWKIDISIEMTGWIGDMLGARKMGVIRARLR